jgi:hypothetical protein
MRTGRLLLLSLLLLAPPWPARADLIQVSWAGTINFVSTAIASGFTVGDPASGSFLIDTAIADSDADPLIGLYFDAVSNIASDFGGYLASSASGAIQIRNGSAALADEMIVAGNTPTGNSVEGIPISAIVFDVADQTQALFASDAIPTSLDLADLTGHFAKLDFFDIGLNSVTANLTSLSYTPIPEPGSGLLLGLGTLALAALRRR